MTDTAGRNPPVMSPGLDLDAIEARANAATPGPWHWILGYGIGVAGVGAITLDGDGPRMTPDQDFVCRARMDVPALIARVREQEQEIARLRSALEEQQQRAMGQLWAHDQVQHP